MKYQRIKSNRAEAPSGDLDEKTGYPRVVKNGPCTFIYHQPPNAEMLVKALFGSREALVEAIIRNENGRYDSVWKRNAADS